MPAYTRLIWWGSLSNRYTRQSVEQFESHTIFLDLIQIGIHKSCVLFSAYQDNSVASGRGGGVLQTLSMLILPKFLSPLTVTNTKLYSAQILYFPT